MSDTHDKDFLEYVVKAIVDHPDDVAVDRKVDEMGVLLSLKVNSEDMGEVIGRNGNTAKSLRTLLRIVGLRGNARVNLKILEPEGGRGPRHSRDEADAPKAPAAPAAEAASAEEVANVVEELKAYLLKEKQDPKEQLGLRALRDLRDLTELQETQERLEM